MAIDIEAFSGQKLPSSIDSVGVEFEGYWHRTDRRQYRDEWDRSVGTVDEWIHGSQDINTACPTGFKYDGSVHSISGYHSGEVCTPGRGFTTWNGLRRWMLEMYPTRVDAFCGLHVHLGCTHDKLLYAFDKRFWGELNRELPKVVKSKRTKDWLENRIKNGRSTAAAGTYSAPNAVTDAIDDWRHQGRYRAVNYRDAFDSHRTMEIRVLPMAATTRGASEAALEAVRMVWKVIAITSDFWTDEKWNTKVTGKVIAGKHGLELPSSTSSIDRVHTDVEMTKSDGHIVPPTLAHTGQRGDNINCLCRGCRDIRTGRIGRTEQVQ